MNVKEHFFMTFMALILLGLIIAKPGIAYQDEVKVVDDYKINESIVLGE